MLLEHPGRKVVAQNGLLGLYRGYSMGATREGGDASEIVAAISIQEYNQ